MLRRWSRRSLRLRRRGNRATPAIILLSLMLPASRADAVDEHVPAQMAETSPSQEAPCTLQPGPLGTVSRIIDAETIAMSDGSEVRLIGALAPRSRDKGAKATAWPPETAAVDALRDLLLGQTVKLSFGTQRKDRYGRLLAHVFLDPEGERSWVQGLMLSRGMARAYALPGAGECLAELLANERPARDGNQGLWSVLTYRPIRSDRTGLLLSLRSTFQIVTGQVLAVSRTRTSIYLNFGTDWKLDFSIKIPLKLAKSYPAWNAKLEELKGKTIEVRGWIERNNGPLIEISQPGEIVADGALALTTNGADGESDTLPLEEPAGTGNGPTPPNGDAGLAADPPNTENEKRPEPKAPGALDL